MSKERAFVRYTKAGKIVPGSLILTQGSYPNGPGLWKEITTDLCCENNNTMNYKVYTALLSQSGTNAPVATVLENTLGGDVTYTYTSTGSYVITLPSSFSNIWVSLTSNNAGSNGILEYDINSFPTSTITLQSNEFTENSPADINLADNVLYLASIEIRVYP